MIYISWNLTVLQAIENGEADIHTHSASKRLKEKWGHAVGARSCDGCHLFHGNFYFLPIELSEQHCIHIFRD